MKRTFNIIGNSRIFLSISAVLVVASIVCIAVFGLRAGIDFVGGTLWQMQLDGDSVAIQQTLTDAGVENPLVYKETTNDSFIVKTKAIDEDEHQRLLSILEASFGDVEELRFESIGPAIGSQLRFRAINAALFVLIAISLYIAISFRTVSYPVKSWKYGVVTLVTLFHDVLIPTGMLAVLGYFQGIEMDTNFVVALLVIMGFSVHDTIVVFDRIRENVLRQRNASFEEVVNTSINQTIARSINTSLTLVVVLVAMIVIGAASLQFFVLTVLVGTIVGTYSSIFLASPLLTIWYKFGKNKA